MAEGLEPVRSADQLRQAFGYFPSGVLALCAAVDGVPIGMAASSFTSVSLSPPLVSVCIQKTSATWPVLRDRGRLGLSVLAEHQDRQCASLASKHGDRFAGSEWVSTSDAAVLIGGASLWLDCSLHVEVPAGDHLVVLLQVHRLRTDPTRAPLVFHGSQFRRLATI